MQAVWKVQQKRNGASLVASSYISRTSESVSLPESSDSADASSIVLSETSQDISPEEWDSDHLAVACEFAFANDSDQA
ncbi:DNAse I-like superfamily protein [Perilla frutescens var. hirtella]|nr:DNAse I-like superfamily protein [Perilla frutescens var. hirtella]